MIGIHESVYIDRLLFTQLRKHIVEILFLCVAVNTEIKQANKKTKSICILSLLFN